MKKDTEIRFRVKTEFKEQLKKLAKEENRTLSSYIENILLKEIKNKGH